MLLAQLLIKSKVMFSARRSSGALLHSSAAGRRSARPVDSRERQMPGDEGDELYFHLPVLVNNSVLLSVLLNVLDAAGLTTSKYLLMACSGVGSVYLS